jgi:hypothetical protein
MPLGPKPMPSPRPLARDYDESVGTFYVADVSVGTHMQGIHRHEVKSLRVIESPEKRAWTRSAWEGQGQQAPGMNWHNFENKRILGTVPVEADGSAYFEVPADRFVFFQLLDEDGMMVQSMRSGTITQSGEQQGCVGCHDRRVDSIPVTSRMPLAMKRPASKLNGWHGEPRKFSFQTEIQPIFDRHCVRCHDFGMPAGKVLNLAADRTIVFNASYIDLWSKDYLSCIGGGPADIQPARSWGSSQSRLIEVLREGHEDHEDVKLTGEELERLITWVDLNAPYYPTYESAYPGNTAGRSPLTPAEEKELATLTGAKFVTNHGHKQRAQVSFARPELSPALASLKTGSPEYERALGIIREGARRLLETPRCDMAGFTPATPDRIRLAKYERRQAVESANRRAIQQGTKLYDRDFE